MRVLVAPGTYKGTMTSIIAANEIKRTLTTFFPKHNVDVCNLADGGEGTLDVFSNLLKLEIHIVKVQNALGKQIQAKIGVSKQGLAIIETSQSIGLSLLSVEQRNPWKTSSYGVGQLITYAIENGAQKILLTMGDSATMDIGIGMLSALGVKFYSNNKEFLPTTAQINEITGFDASSLYKKMRNIEIIGLADTENPLCGNHGQVKLFGKQKGLSDADIIRLESDFNHFGEIIQNQTGVNVNNKERTSASGGIGAALHGILQAPLINAVQYIQSIKGDNDVISNADIVITGEGCLDQQTRLGKVPFYVASKTKGLCILIVGKYTEDGLVDIKSVCDNIEIHCLPSLREKTNPIFELSYCVQDIFKSIQ